MMNHNKEDDIMIQEMTIKLLEVGDRVYTDKNETFYIVGEHGMYYIRDMEGCNVGFGREGEMFNTLQELSMCLHINFKEIEIDRRKYKVGDSIKVDNQDCVIIDMSNHTSPKYGVLSVHTGSHECYSVLYESYGHITTLIGELIEEGLLK